jgi:hypothetical protein
METFSYFEKALFPRRHVHARTFFSANFQFFTLQKTTFEFSMSKPVVQVLYAETNSRENVLKSASFFWPLRTKSSFSVILHENSVNFEVIYA